MAAHLAIVGLGNPGTGYARTRHNLGARLVERLASDLRVELKRQRGGYRSADAELEGSPVILAVPTSFMNESGGPVGRLVRKARIPAEQLIVVHDELDIPLGRVRLKAGGGVAGHRGLASIRDSLRTQDFLRVRIGIGRPEPGSEAVEKVLTSFRPEEKDVVDKVLDLAIEGLHILVRDGLDAAQNRLHSAPEARRGVGRVEDPGRAQE